MPVQAVEKLACTGTKALLFTQVGNWVITRVCQQIADWQRAGEEGIQVTVNVSRQQTADETFSRFSGDE
ncbi:hypothetical protein [Pseudomonas bubulae]|uniref:hypothetical protein n=1 Tax=Pseudomonas bubulae TaxID=2316085 RepID=UPI0039A278A4